MLEDAELIEFTAADDYRRKAEHLAGRSDEAGMNEESSSVHRARVSWNADSGDVRAHTVELAAQRLAASSAAEFGGNPDKADPEEMFVASLSSCHMLWFLALARAERIRVTSYEDDPEGTMDGTRFTRVVLRPRVAFASPVDNEQVKSLHHRAHERCFIANSVSCAVNVEPQQAATDSLRSPGPSLPDEPIRLSAYDPGWPARFEEERAALEVAIGAWIVGGIHHVGSTAVPGLDAKPIIDILAGVRDLDESRACFEPLAQLGYMYAPYLPDEMHWFCKPHPSRRTHHLHLVPTGSKRYRDELEFRDRLRLDPEAAAEYAALKHTLADRHRNDREAYTDAKEKFIRRILAR